jgi:hypothetical protein
VILIGFTSKKIANNILKNVYRTRFPVGKTIPCKFALLDSKNNIHVCALSDPNNFAFIFEHECKKPQN